MAFLFGGFQQVNTKGSLDRETVCVLQGHPLQGLLKVKPVGKPPKRGPAVTYAGLSKFGALFCGIPLCAFGGTLAPNSGHSLDF